MVESENISIVIGDDDITATIEEENIDITLESGMTTNSGKVKISNTDTSSDYLTTKLTSGVGITLLKLNSGDEESLQVTNSSPDQTVSFTGGTNVIIGGTYPNFTVTDNSLTTATLSSYVPYTGATGDVNLGDNDITAANLTGTNTGDQDLSGKLDGPENFNLNTETVSLGTGNRYVHSSILVGNSLFLGTRSTVGRIIKIHDSQNLAGTKTVITLPTGNNNVEAVTYNETNNRLYFLLGVTSGTRVVELNPDTMAYTIMTYADINSGTSGGIATDGTYLYVISYNTPSIIAKYDLTLQLISSQTLDYGVGHSLAYDKEDGYLYGAGASDPSWVVKINSSDLSFTNVLIEDATTISDDIALTGDYFWCVAESGDHQIIRVKKSDLSHICIGTDAYIGYGCSFNPYDNCVYVAYANPVGEYHKIDINKNIVSIHISPTTLGALNEIIFDPQNIYLTKWANPAFITRTRGFPISSYYYFDDTGKKLEYSDGDLTLHGDIKGDRILAGMDAEDDDNVLQVDTYGKVYGVYTYGPNYPGAVYTGVFSNDNPKYAVTNYNHNIRVYAYVLVGDTKVYSTDYIQGSQINDITDNSSSLDPYEITWQWLPVDDADGYLVLHYLAVEGGSVTHNYDYYTETTNTSIIDNSSLEWQTPVPSLISELLTTPAVFESDQFKSTLAIGTKPFDIVSTTLNTNLNADLLDGSHASSFETAGVCLKIDQSGTPQSISGGQPNFEMGFTSGGKFNWTTAGNAIIQATGVDRINIYEQSLLNGQWKAESLDVSTTASTTGTGLSSQILGQQGLAVTDATPFAGGEALLYGGTGGELNKTTTGAATGAAGGRVINYGGVGGKVTSSGAAATGGLGGNLFYLGGVGGRGIGVTNRVGRGGAGGNAILYGGAGGQGGDDTIFTSVQNTGGAGGYSLFQAGTGGVALGSSLKNQGGAGGLVTIQAGYGQGSTSTLNSPATNQGGAGGSIEFVAGKGGGASGGSASNVAGANGNMYFQLEAVATASGAGAVAGTQGNIYFQPDNGANPSATPWLVINGTDGNTYLPGDTRTLYFGAGNDCSILYNGTNMIIDPKVVGSGVLQVSGNTTITNGSNSSQLKVLADDTGVYSTGGGVLVGNTTLGYGTWQGASSIEGVNISGAGAVTADGILWINYYSIGYTNIGNAGGGLRVGADSGAAFLTGYDLEVISKTIVKDKISFTQTDGNEYIDSLNDGYMDYGATTAHRFNNPLILSNVKSGATQAGASAVAGEVWKTSGHATLPDNVLMIGV
jgi:hypothetical protein